MNEENFHKRFVALLEQKIPKKSKLADFIADILLIEKESAYRRLRGVVQFSFEEACLLSQKLSISLDELLGTTKPRSRPFYLQLTNFADPKEIDYYMVNEYNDFLRLITPDPISEFGMAAKMLPDVFHLKFNAINRFNFFNWHYQYDPHVPQKKYHEIRISDKMNKLLMEMHELYQQIKVSSFVFDNSIFQHFVNDVRYFVEIELLRPNDVKIIREELLGVIDALEEIADKGVNSLGNKVSFYITNTSFNSGFFYIDTPHYSLSVVRALGLYDISSLDDLVLKTAKVWMNSLKKASFQISESGEIQRKKFFNEQRKIVEAGCLS